MKPDEQIEIDLFPGNELKNDTTFVLGATGCGKTSLIANLLRQRERWTLIDTREEYPPSFFNDVTLVEDTRSPGTEPRGIYNRYLEALNREKKRLIVRVPINSDDEEFIDRILYRLVTFQRANKHIAHTFCMDELSKFCTLHYCPKYLKEIIERGRGLNIQKIFGAQWFSSIPTWMRDTVSKFYVFRHQEPRGVAALANYGFDTETVQMMPEHYCIKREHGVNKLLKVSGRRLP